MHGAADGDAPLRAEIAARLQAGLRTEAFPRAEDTGAVERIVARLRREAGDDLERKLVIAGVTGQAPEVDGLEQPCETCMYFLVHRRFCDLPELALPVEPGWSCRLWRI